MKDSWCLLLGELLDNVCFNKEALFSKDLGIKILLGLQCFKDASLYVYYMDGDGEITE
jgi:hypothetical protein